MKNYLTSLLLIVFVLNFSSCKKDDLTSIFEGTWSSNAIITIVDNNGEFQELDLNIELTFDQDLNVSGTIGNAILQDCLLKDNKKNLGNWIGIKRDYILYNGIILGKIDAIDVVDEREFTLPFDLNGNIIEGSIMIIYDWRDPQLFGNIELEKIN